MSWSETIKINSNMTVSLDKLIKSAKSELIDLIKWYSSKKELKNILNDALNNKFMKEIKILKIKS